MKTKQSQAIHTLIPIYLKLFIFAFLKQTFKLSILNLIIKSPYLFLFNQSLSNAINAYITIPVAMIHIIQNMIISVLLVNSSKISVIVSFLYTAIFLPSIVLFFKLPNIVALNSCSKP